MSQGMPNPADSEAAPKRGFQVQEAVEYTGRTRTSLYEDIRSGRLRSYKIGKRRLLLREDLDEYLDRITGHAAP